jgi:glutaredoxin
MVSKQVTAYYSIECPICFQLRPLLRRLCMDKGVHLTEIYLDTYPRNDLVDKYYFLMRVLFGGEEHFPVIHVGEENWIIPRRTSTWQKVSPEKPETLRPVLDEALKEVKRALEKPDEVYLPSHLVMLEMLRHRTLAGRVSV